jgi:hypothetical protein
VQERVARPVARHAVTARPRSFDDDALIAQLRTSVARLVH